MRLTFLLLVIAAALFSCSDATASGSSPAKLAISNSADPLHNGDAAEIIGKRSLRGSIAQKSRYFDEEETKEEERALPNLSKLDDVANLKVLVDIFKNFDDTGVRGLMAFMEQGKMNRVELLSMLKLYDKFRAVGPDDFMVGMRKANEL